MSKQCTTNSSQFLHDNPGLVVVNLPSIFSMWCFDPADIVAAPKISYYRYCLVHISVRHPHSNILRTEYVGDAATYPPESEKLIS